MEVMRMLDLVLVKRYVEIYERNRTKSSVKLVGTGIKRKVVNRTGRTNSDKVKKLSYKEEYIRSLKSKSRMG